MEHHSGSASKATRTSTHVAMNEHHVRLICVFFLRFTSGLLFRSAVVRKPRSHQQLCFWQFSTNFSIQRWLANSPVNADQRSFKCRLLLKSWNRPQFINVFEGTISLSVGIAAFDMSTLLNCIRSKSICACLHAYGPIVEVF